MIPVECFFALSALLFFIGVYGFVTRRNLIAMLISVELVLNAVDINFAAINRLLYPNGMEGMFMTLFVIGVAAAESAVAIAIIINVYRAAQGSRIDRHLLTGNRHDTLLPHCLPVFWNGSCGGCLSDVCSL